MKCHACQKEKPVRRVWIAYEAKFNMCDDCMALMMEFEPQALALLNEAEAG